MEFRVVPLKGKSYEGRQFGYVIEQDGLPAWYVSTGGTGSCWNIREVDDEGGDLMHVCELDELIGALEALRESDANKEHVARWEG